VGDCKMAARETRAFIASKGDYYLCPLPQGQLGAGELDEALKAIWRGEQALCPVFRARAEGEPELIAQGYERQGPISREVDGGPQSWTERR
jgi:hypothetical protein